METGSYQEQLQSLGQRLQTVLQQDVPIATTVRCLMKQGKLLILVQHGADVTLDAKKTFAGLKRVLKGNADELVHQLSPESSTLPIQLYLRGDGQPQPYAFHPFAVEASPPPIDSFFEEGGLEDEPLGQLGDGADDLSGDLSGDLSVGLASHGEDGLMEMDEKPATLAIASQRSRPSGSSGEVDDRAASGDGPSYRAWMIGGAIAGVVVVAGVVGYGLTRPCVVGGCKPLEQAAELHQQATERMVSATSPQEIAEIYDQLTEAATLTTQVPSWSGRYEEAIAQQKEYATDAATVDRVRQAQTAAFSAAQKSQNPPHPLETWQDIRGLWEEAIAQLEDVPSGSALYPFAQQKLAEYRNNLATINRRIEIEEAAQTQVQSARDRVQPLTPGTAIETPEQQYATLAAWEAAIALLRSVPADTMSYGDAQQLLALYQTEWAQLRDRTPPEAGSAMAQQRSLDAADRAAGHEDARQWSLAVAAWQEALSYAQQVSPASPYYAQTQPMITAYRRALASAQTELQGAIARQSVDIGLRQLCSGTVPSCTYSLRDAVQVRLTATYQPTAIPFPVAADASSPALTPTAIDGMLYQIGQVGESANVEIDLYNADGSLFGRYVPELDGYVPPSYITVLDQAPADTRVEARPVTSLPPVSVVPQ